VTAPTEELRSAPLAAAHAPAGFLLSAEVGWNQTVEDWRLMLEEGEAIGQFSAAGQLVASALILPYDERVAWVAMVLTSAEFRRRGLATRNLQWALERCRERKLLAGLDATPDGVAVYRPLGFEDVCGLHRLRAEQPGGLVLPRRDAALRPLQAARDLDAIARLDALVFGAERRRLLAYLGRSEPRRALLAEADGDLAGFVLARAGRAALHVGPLVARNSNVATLLLAQALVGAAGPVSIDVPDHQPEFQAVLRDAGFEPVRPFTRMVRAEPARVGELAGCFAIAGPEFG
jgi:GNAT superfamily N-acetyltransferase